RRIVRCRREATGQAASVSKARQRRRGGEVRANARPPMCCRPDNKGDSTAAARQPANHGGGNLQPLVDDAASNALDSPRGRRDHTKTRTLRYVNWHRVIRQPMTTDNHADIVLMTALPLEETALLKYIGPSQESKAGGRTYHRGNVGPYEDIV